MITLMYCENVKEKSFKICLPAFLSLDLGAYIEQCNNYIAMVACQTVFIADF